MKRKSGKILTKIALAAGITSGLAANAPLANHLADRIRQYRADGAEADKALEAAIEMPNPQDIAYNDLMKVLNAPPEKPAPDGIDYPASFTQRDRRELEATERFLAAQTSTSDERTRALGNASVLEDRTSNDFQGAAGTVAALLLLNAASGLGLNRLLKDEKETKKHAAFRAQYEAEIAEYMNKGPSR